jgi:hypothetical protein
MTDPELYKRLCEAILAWDDMDEQFLADNPTFLLNDIEEFAKQIRASENTW